MEVSTLLTAVAGGIIVAILQYAWNNWFPPIIQKFYRDEPQIGGEWRTTFTEGNKEYHEQVTLKQKGRRVSGRIILTTDSDDGTTTYSFEGQFKNTILSATYESSDPSDYEQGAFVLHYRKGKRFDGQYILSSKESEDLISSPYNWRPKA